MNSSIILILIEILISLCLDWIIKLFVLLRSKPTKKIRASVVSHCEVSPFWSCFLDLPCLAWNSASNLSPNHAFVEDKIIVFGPNCVNFVPLSPSVCVKVFQVNRRTWGWSRAREKSIFCVAGVDWSGSPTCSKSQIGSRETDECFHFILEAGSDIVSSRTVVSSNASLYNLPS